MSIDNNKIEGGGRVEKDLRELAEGNFSRWNETLQSKNAQRVAEMYTEDAAFLPTMSPEFKRGVSGAREYFEHFLKKNPFGKLKAGWSIQPAGDNSYSHNGMYDFEVDDSRGGRVIVSARFTFNWKLQKDGHWKITAHHSSVVPA
jgi:uncharacterized protein (TIGR02246 family)